MIDDDATGIGHELADIGQLRAMHRGQSTSVQVESGEGFHRSIGADEDRSIVGGDEVG